jgi:hypothetical protein
LWGFAAQGNTQNRKQMEFMMDSNDPHKAKLNDYLANGINKVDGWCIPQLWQSIWPLVPHVGLGPVAEIGVFEGKFLIGLVKTFDPEGTFNHAAIDVFDLQEFNIDKAGVGKLAVLDDNISRHGIDVDTVEKVRADSLTLRAADAAKLIAQRGKFKFFSVDGCHEVTHTMNDIEFAMSVIDNKGIIAIDDYLNPNWPGVLEAVSKMYLLRNFPFIPLIFSCNKLLLCSYSYHAKYLNLILNYLKENHPTTRIKMVTRFGYNTLSVLPKLATWEDLK